MRFLVSLGTLLLIACGGTSTPPSNANERADTGPVEEAYLRQAERRDVEFTRLAERRFVTAVSEGDVRVFQADHEEMLRATFERNRARYTDLEPQVRARHILVRSTGGEPPQATRIRADRIRTRVLGGEDFATVAAAESDDTGSARRGGDVGYFARDRMVAAFSEAAFALGDGEISEVVETRFGFHIIRVEGHREGTLSFDQVAPELAERGARVAARRAAMDSAADDIIHRLQGGATLEDALLAAFPDRPPPTTTRAVYLGVPWPFRPEIQEHVASSDAPSDRWAESLHGNREMIIVVVTRHPPDLAELTPAMADCIREREARSECDTRYEEGPCDACVPAAIDALATVRAMDSDLRPVQVRQHVRQALPSD